MTVSIYKDLIARDDVKLWDGDTSNRTFDRKTSTGGTVTLTKFGSGTYYFDTIASATITAATITALTTGGNIIFPGQAAGDLLTFNGTLWVPLAKGTARQELQMNAGATAPAWAASVTSTLTAQGDLPYASAANTLARLAIGAANLKLFSNAAGTAPEYAAGLSIGSLTRANTADSGDVSYTGTGFKPAVLIFVTFVSGQTSLCIGFDTAAARMCAYGWGQATTAMSGNTTAAIESIESGSDNQTAIVKTMDANGFTLTWTKNGTPGGTTTVLYLALR